MAAIVALIFLGVVVVFVISLVIIYYYARKYLNGDYVKVPADEELGEDCTADDAYTEQKLHPFEEVNVIDKNERKISAESLDTKSFRENILEETKRYSEIGAYYREKYPKASSTASPVSARSLRSQRRNQSQTNISSSLSKKVPIRQASSSENISSPYRTQDKTFREEPIVKNEEPRLLKSNEQETTQTLSTSETLFQKAQMYYQYTEDNISDKIKTKGFDYEFASEAVLFCAVHYYETSKILFINVKKLEGLYLLDRNCPQEINFHFKITPKNRFHSKTRWKPVESKLLSLTHSMGPLTIVDIQKSSLLIRLYGRLKKTFGRQKCYGEVIITLNDILGKEEEVAFEKKILPKAGKIIYSSSEDLLSEG